MLSSIEPLSAGQVVRCFIASERIENMCLNSVKGDALVEIMVSHCVCCDLEYF